MKISNAEMDKKLEITVGKTIEAISRIERFIIKYGSDLNNNQVERISNKLKELPKYLRPLGVGSLRELTLDQGNQLFVQIIQDFKNYKITLDELSVFGSKIFHEVAKNKSENSDLFFTSLSASELNFAVRSSSVYGNISIYLKDIDTFIKKYGPKI